MDSGKRVTTEERRQVAVVSLDQTHHDSFSDLGQVIVDE